MKTSLATIALAFAFSIAGAAEPPKPTVPQPKPKVEVLEVTSGGALTFAGVGKPDLAISLTVENKSSVVLKNISLSVSNFVSPNGESAEATVDPKIAEIPAGATETFKIKASIPWVAAFTARARVLQGKQVLLPFKIDVVRAKAKPPVDVGDVPVIQRTANLGHGAVPIPVKIKLYATEGGGSLPPPVLHSAIRRPKVDSKAGDAAEDVRLDISGIKLIEAAAKPPKPRATGQTVTPPAGSIVVKAGEPLEITPNVTGIGSPGRYDLKIRFAGIGYDVIEKDVSINVQDSGFIAFGWIFLGVFLSLLFHAYLSATRPRLLIQLRIEEILAALRAASRAAVDNEGRQLVEEVRKAVRDDWDARLAKRQALAPQIELYEQVAPAVGAWIRMRNDVVAIRLRDVRQNLLQKLDDAAGPFREKPLDPTRVSASIAAIAQFPGTIRTEITNELQKSLDALDQDLRGDTRQDAARLRGALQAAEDKLQAGQLEAAISAYDAARRQYAALVVDRLTERVKGSAVPGITPKEWSAVQSEIAAAASAVQSAKSADDAITIAAAAMKGYLYAVVAALRGAAKGLDAAAAKAVTDELDMVATSIDSDKLTEAWLRFEAARNAYQTARTGQPMSAVLAAMASGGALGGALDVVQLVDMPPPAHDLDSPGSVARTQFQLTLGDKITSVVVLIVATLSGLQVLWVDNPTWGGWASYLAAFGWGFALDQFTHAGITALRSR